MWEERISWEEMPAEIGLQVLAELARLLIQLGSAERAAHQTDEVVRALTLELEAPRYQAARAERQYDAVEPENRLVAETLE